MANNAFRVQRNLTFIPPLLYLLNHQEQATGDKKARVIQVSSLRAWEGGQGGGRHTLPKGHVGSGPLAHPGSGSLFMSSPSSQVSPLSSSSWGEDLKRGKGRFL